MSVEDGCHMQAPAGQRGPLGQQVLAGRLWGPSEAVGLPVTVFVGK